MKYSWYYFGRAGMCAADAFLCIGPTGCHNPDEGWHEIESVDINLGHRQDGDGKRYIMEFQIYNFKKKHNAPVDLRVEKEIPYTP